MRRAAAFLFTVVLASCNAATAPTIDANDVLLHWVKWNAHGLTTYSFDYSVQAMIQFVGCPTAAWRISVQQKNMAAAICLATGAAASAPNVTMDSLFAQALRATHQNGTNSISYDPQWSFPATLGLNQGIPDAGHTEKATNLQQP